MQGLADTPSRVARMYEDIFFGVGLSTEAAIDTVFEAASHDPVVVSGLLFYSICEHHLLPFFGEARLAYIPSSKIAGISKLARALEVAAHRPQVQERLTSQVADQLMEALDPRGALVVIEAEHQCMSMRGVQKPGSLTLTSAVRGIFLSDATRAEAFQLIGIGR